MRKFSRLILVCLLGLIWVAAAQADTDLQISVKKKFELLSKCTGAQISVKVDFYDSNDRGEEVKPTTHQCIKIELESTGVASFDGRPTGWTTEDKAEDDIGSGEIKKISKTIKVGDGPVNFSEDLAMDFSGAGHWSIRAKVTLCGGPFPDTVAENKTYAMPRVRDGIDAGSLILGKEYAVEVADGLADAINGISVEILSTRAELVTKLKGMKRSELESATQGKDAWADIDSQEFWKVVDDANAPKARSKKNAAGEDESRIVGAQKLQQYAETEADRIMEEAERDLDSALSAIIGLLLKRTKDFTGGTVTVVGVYRFCLGEFSPGSPGWSGIAAAPIDRDTVIGIGIGAPADGFNVKVTLTLRQVLNGDARVSDKNSPNTRLFASTPVSVNIKGETKFRLPSAPPLLNVELAPAKPFRLSSNLVLDLVAQEDQSDVKVTQ